jgi:hypothetical protein
LDLDTIPDADAGVPPDHGLDTDQTLSFVIGLCSADDRRGRFATPDLDDVPEADLEPLPRLHIQTGGAETDVLLEGFGNPERDRLAHRRTFLDPGAD